MPIILILKRKKFEKKTAFSGGFVSFVLFSGSAGVKKAVWVSDGLWGSYGKKNLSAFYPKKFIL